MLTGPRGVAVMIGLTAVSLVGVAMIAQIRHYTIRLCHLFCATGGLPSPEDAEIHSVT